MPSETKQAVQWATNQTVTNTEMGISYEVTKDTPIDLVDKVRQYFNDNNITYSTFSYDDLRTYLN